MAELTGKIVTYCIQNDFVAASDEAWLRYGIEKRLSMLLGFVPVTAVAVFLSSPPAAVGFLVSFYLLRRKTSGYHAKTAIGCLCTSIFLEFLFFRLMYPCLDGTWMMIVGGISTLIIFRLAPYNHPGMNFTREELRVLQFHGRGTTVALLSVAFLFWGTGLRDAARGLTVGTAMTAFALCLAYFHDWRTLK